MQMFLSLPAFIGTKVIGAEPMTKGQFQIVFERSHPDNSPVEAEGYHVQYLNPNGSTYDSWSPKNVFDEAYRSLDGGLTFGDAIFFLKQGKKLARKGWNGKGIFIELQVPDEHSKMTSPYIFIDTTGLRTDNPAAPKSRVPWLASQTDMLCEDWCIVE